MPGLPTRVTVSEANRTLGHARASPTDQAAGLVAQMRDLRAGRRGTRRQRACQQQSTAPNARNLSVRTGDVQ